MNVNDQFSLLKIVKSLLFRLHTVIDNIIQLTSMISHSHINIQILTQRSIQIKIANF